MNMFAAYCPRHHSKILFSESEIRRLTNVDGSILVEVQCFDGERIVLHTGRRRSQVRG